MLEMIMLKSLRELTQQQVNFITISSIESEIICTFAYAFHPSVRSSEIVSESSQPYSTSAQ